MGNSAQVNCLFCSFSATPRGRNAIVAQLVEHNLPKVGVASSRLVYRSNLIHTNMTKLKPWRLISAKPSDKVVTRDGREVLKWELIGDPKESLWVTQVTVRDPADRRKKMKYVVNHNGRRYANVQSNDDILIEVAAKVREPQSAGCMPAPIRGIKAIQEGDMAGVRLANKESGFWRKTGACDNVYIGSNSDE